MTGPTIVHAAYLIDDGQLLDANALLIENGRIAELGMFDELRARHASAAVRDHSGGTITRGLIDGHAHPVWGLMVTVGHSLVACHTPADLRAELQRIAGGLAAHEPFIGWGLEAVAFGDEVTNDLLHEIFGTDRVSVIHLVDCHSAVVSRRVLELAGISGPREYIDGSAIVERREVGNRDGIDRLSGHIVEFSALDAVWPHLPQSPLEQQAGDLHELLGQMARSGLTEAWAMDTRGGARVFDLLETAEQQGELPIRLRISPWCTPTQDGAGASELLAIQGRSGRRWRVEGVKFFLDGVIDGGTAWLSSPDQQGESTRAFWNDVDAFARRVREFDAADVPTVTHAIGDAAVDATARVLAEIVRARGEGDAGPLHRIDHLELVRPETVALIGDAQLSVCLQPTHCTHFVSESHDDGWSRRVGDRWVDGWPAKRLQDAGATVSLASDWRVAPFDPRSIVTDTVLRRSAGSDVEPVYPGEALSVADALRGYTTNAGARLVPGAAADLTVWADNPLAIDPGQIASTPILATYIGGEQTA